MATEKNIDVKEQALARTGNILNTLLLDRTTKKNIIWATDSYSKKGPEYRGEEFSAKKQMRPELVTGFYQNLIQPRAVKNLTEQRHRTKTKAEVFTPSLIVDQMNTAIDQTSWSRPPDETNWCEYVRELKLEMTCGEAPFIVSRYDATTNTQELVELSKRVGFLDRKLQIVSQFCQTKDEWIAWAKEAFKASYGYEWQGDNVLIARENLFYTLIDYHEDKFASIPDLPVLEEFAEIISWNIFQMDGLKYVVPQSCRHVETSLPFQPTFDGITDLSITEVVEKDECEGCKFNRPMRHNGIYVKIMDWKKNKPIRFSTLLDSSQ